MEYLSAGEKIKGLRKRLGLKQEDLTDDETISKSLISMIEMGKRGLTPQSAAIIAESFNFHLRKIGEEITPEWLLQKPQDQIRKEINKHLETLKKAVDSGRADVELVKNTFDIAMGLIKMGDEFQKELMELKIIRGNFYYDNYQYKEAQQDYLDVLDYNMKTGNFGEVARVYILLASTFQMQMIMDSAINYYTKAYETAVSYQTENQDKVKVYSIFNKILCYRKLRQYDLALSHIDIFKSLRWSDPLFKTYQFRVLLYEANTYRDLAIHYSAEQLYKSILERVEKFDPETRFLVYENYGLYQRKLGNRKDALKYFEKALALKHEVNFNYLPALYLYQSTCYNLKEEFDIISSLLEEGIKLADMVSKKRMMIEIRFAYIDVFIKLKDYDTALQQLQLVERIVLETVAKPLLHDLYSYYIEVYNKLGDEEKSTEYALKIRQKSQIDY